MVHKFLFIFATILCCLSCNNDSDSFDVEEVTAADLFLVSDEFKEYEQVVKEDSRIVRNALKVLTADEKRRYFTLMKSASPEMTDDEYNVVVAEIQELTGIDTDARLRKLHEARVKLTSKMTFSKTELLKAMQRQCLNVKKVTMTRSSNENNTSDCLHTCENVYASVYSQCDPTDGYGPGHNSTHIDYDLWCQTRYCEMLASDAYDKCAMGCY